MIKNAIFGALIAATFSFAACEKNETYTLEPSQSESVPAATLPEPILNWLADNYPNHLIVYGKLHGEQYHVTLRAEGTGTVQLLFSKEGVFLQEL